MGRTVGRLIKSRRNMETTLVRVECAVRQQQKSGLALARWGRRGSGKAKKFEARRNIETEKTAAEPLHAAAEFPSGLLEDEQGKFERSGLAA